MSSHFEFQREGKTFFTFGTPECIGEWPIPDEMIETILITEGVKEETGFLSPIVVLAAIRASMEAHRIKGLRAGDLLRAEDEQTHVFCEGSIALIETLSAGVRRLLAGGGHHEHPFLKA